MAIIADLLMMSGALAAGFYCFVLSRRLTALKDAEGGIGHAVAALSAQVDELGKSVAVARRAAGQSNSSLEELTDRAETVAQRLELMVASMHDIPDASAQTAVKSEPDEPMFSSRLRRGVGA